MELALPRDPCTAMAATILALLFCSHLLGADGKGPEVRKEPGEAASRFQGFNCAAGPTRILNSPTHQDCQGRQRGGGGEQVWSGNFALIQRRRVENTRVFTCTLRRSSYIGHWYINLNLCKLCD
jgi:hypothetical protein